MDTIKFEREFRPEENFPLPHDIHLIAPMLAETSDDGAPLPPGGVPYPYFGNLDADMQSYYTSVTDLLNATPPEAFTPTISQLDLLIQSMQITP